MSALKRIVIKGDGFAGHTSIEFDGNKIGIITNATLNIQEDQWVTLDVRTIGEIDIDTLGLLHFTTPEGKKYRVVEVCP
jgi:hypothetical protein